MEFPLLTIEDALYCNDAQVCIANDYDNVSGTGNIVCRVKRHGVAEICQNTAIPAHTQAETAHRFLTTNRRIEQ